MGEPDKRGKPLIAAAPPLADQGRGAAAGFERHYGVAPGWMAAAPGRVNLIGEHVDYNGGLVLPMAIDRYTVVAAAPSPEPRVRAWSTAGEAETTVATDPPPQPGVRGWGAYLAGVLAGFEERGARLPGLDLWIDSSVPVGGGLASSAALEVALATLLGEVTGLRLSTTETARLCQAAEERFAGVPCGLMDPLISLAGRAEHFLLLDCASLEWTPVPLGDDSVSILITHTGVRHSLADGAYALRRRQCESAAQALGLASLRDADLHGLAAARGRMEETVYRRARHVVTEDQRTRRMVQALAHRSWTAAGQVLYEGHASLKDDFEVSCAELDALVAISRALGPEAGLFGCRMTGGGFGGCTVSLVLTECLAEIAQVLEAEYRTRMGAPPTFYACRPAVGAQSVGLGAVGPREA